MSPFNVNIEKTFSETSDTEDEIDDYKIVEVDCNGDEMDGHNLFAFREIYSDDLFDALHSVPALTDFIGCIHCLNPIAMKSDILEVWFVPLFSEARMLIIVKGFVSSNAVNILIESGQINVCCSICCKSLSTRAFPNFYRSNNEQRIDGVGQCIFLNRSAVKLCRKVTK